MPLTIEIFYLITYPITEHQHITQNTIIYKSAEAVMPGNLPETDGI